MGELDLNYAALYACVINNKLTADKAILKMGIELKREQSKVVKKCQKLSNSYDNEIADLYWKAKWTITKLGQEYGLSPSGMGEYMERNNIAKRKRGYASKSIEDR